MLTDTFRDGFDKFVFKPVDGRIVGEWSEWDETVVIGIAVAITGGIAIAGGIAIGIAIATAPILQTSKELVNRR